MATKKFKLEQPVFDLSAPPAPTPVKEKEKLVVKQEFYNESTQTSTGKTIGLLDALKKIDLDKVSLDDIKISFFREGNRYDEASLKSRVIIHHTAEIDNPNYQTVKNAYVAAIDKHKLETSIYEKDKVKHGYKLSLWKNALELKKLKALKTKTAEDTAKLKALPIAITRLLKKLDMDLKPADLFPVARKKTAVAAKTILDQDDAYNDDYDDDN